MSVVAGERRTAERRSVTKRNRARRAVHRHRFAAVYIFGISAMLLLNVVLAVVVFTSYSERDPFDPLGVYPVQKVTSAVPGVEGNAVRVGDSVEITGIKCNDSDEPVTVRGSVAWRSIEPLGTLVPIGVGVRDADPGCTEQMFNNPMPEAVVLRSLELFEQGHPFVLWAIVGEETPIADDREGVPAVFTSETFKVVP